MKYAIISDIHSNLEAFLAVLKDLDRYSPDEIISLGDAVGYGGNPNECVQIIRSRSIISIMGNHDRACAGIKEPVNFNPAARGAALWTREQLTQENKNYLSALPESRDFGNFIAVHGAISDPDKYILGRFESEPEFELMGDAGICFFGHTHTPVCYSKETAGTVETNNEYKLHEGAKYLVNPGSVGQPRDRDPRASYLIYDTNEGLEFMKVEYDIKKAQKKILDAGLDNFLAERLAYGY